MECVQRFFLSPPLGFYQINDLQQLQGILRSVILANNIEDLQVGL
jgi:hypothetical protein